MGVMLRWDSVTGELTEEGYGARPGSTLLWGTGKGMLGFPAMGWAMPKASGTLQLTFFPRHRLLAPVRHCWPPACPRTQHRVSRGLITAINQADACLAIAGR